MSEQLKKSLLKSCFEFVQLKQNILQESLSDSKNSLSAESQSTAGDKHDTSRAMMHLEIEKKSSQLKGIDDLKRVLNQIDPTQKSSKIGLGSIIETASGHYYIAINAGKIVVDKQEFIAISLASPIAQKFKNTPLNTDVLVMGKLYKVLNVY